MGAPFDYDVDVGYLNRPPIWMWAVALVAGASAIAHGDYVAVAVVWGGGALVWFLMSKLIWLRANPHGLRVRNFWGVQAIAWSDVATVELLPRSFWGVQPIQITLQDGRRVRPFAARTGWKSGHSYDEMDRVVRRLLLLRRRTLGIPDPPELAAALAAARQGDPRPIDALLRAHVVDATLYEERLHEMADRGELDLEQLRKARRDLL